MSVVATRFRISITTFGIVSVCNLFFWSALASASVGSVPRPATSARTVMIQMFEWPWMDLAQECEQVLGPMQIAAVQVSPPQEHLSLGSNFWWERYQPVSFQINSRSGNEDDFRQMVSRCQKVGVDVYVDVILNHMAGIQEGRGFAGTTYSKYNHTGLFSPWDFNFCGRHGDNQIRNFYDRFELQTCELLGLADLKTSSAYVRRTLTAYLDRLIDMGVAGFRLDAAKHIPAGELQAIVDQVKAPVYLVSETLIGPGQPVTINEYTGFSDVNVFPYAFDLAQAFRGGTLGSFIQFPSHYPRSDLAVVFVENHDTQRERPRLTLSRPSETDLFQLAEIFLLTWPYGYPQLFSGYDFQDYDQGPPTDPQGLTLSVFDSFGNCRAPWLCEHRKSYVQHLVRFRNVTNPIFQATRKFTASPGILAFSRGALGFVAINSKLQEFESQIPTDLKDGLYCNLIQKQNTACTETVKVKAGLAHVKLPPLSAIVLSFEEKISP